MRAARGSATVTGKATLVLCGAPAAAPAVARAAGGRAGGGGFNGKRIEGTAWPPAGIRPGIRKQEQRTIRLLVPENRQDFAESFRKTPVISRRGQTSR